MVTDCNCKADARWQLCILRMHTSWKSVIGVIGDAISAAATPLRAGAAHLAATGKVEREVCLCLILSVSVFASVYVCSCM